VLGDLTGRLSDNDVFDKLAKDSYNDRAKEFSMNTLLLWGDKDSIFPSEIGEFANAIIPNSKLVIIKNAGHAPQHDNLSDYVNALLVFLKENENTHDLNGEL